MRVRSPRISRCSRESNPLVRRLVLSLALLLTLGSSRVFAAACSNTAVGTFTCIQSKIGVATTATQTLVLSSLTAGTIILGGVEWNNSATTLNSITASSGCTGMSATLVDNPTINTFAGAGFYITGYSAGACTLLFTFSVAVSAGYGIEEVSGATATGIQHKVGSFTNQGPSATVSAASITALGTDYLFGFFGEASNGSQPSAAGTGYTLRDATGGGTIGRGTEDRSNSGANTVSFVTFANAGNYGSVVALDVAAAGGGATRGLFQVPSLGGLGIGGSFFRDPLQFVGLAGWAFAVLLACAVATHQTLTAVDQIHAHLMARQDAKTQAAALDVKLKAQMETQQSEAKQRELLKVRRG